MTASVVQARRDESQVTARTVVPDSNLTTGNLLMVITGNRAGPVVSVADTGSRIWTPQLGFQNASTSYYVEVWTAPVGTGGTRPTVTATQSGSDYFDVYVIELTGADTSTSPFSTSDVDAGGTNVGPATAGPTGTPGTNELAIMFHKVNGGVTLTGVSAGWTDYANGGETYGNSKFATQTVSSAASGSHTMSGFDNWQGFIVVIKDAGGGGGTVTPPKPVSVRQAPMRAAMR